MFFDKKFYESKFKFSSQKYNTDNLTSRFMWNLKIVLLFCGYQQKILNIQIKPVYTVLTKTINENDYW